VAGACQREAKEGRGEQKSAAEHINTRKWQRILGPKNTGKRRM
jgi:hypothetical protein